MANIAQLSREEAATPFQRGIREALYAGVIAFGLFVLFIGLRTDQNIRNELILVPRWGLLAIVVGLVDASGVSSTSLTASRSLRGRRKSMSPAAAAVEQAAPEGFVRRNFSKHRALLALVCCYPPVAVVLLCRLSRARSSGSTISASRS